mmetsp:Transcript_18140/g.54210  ORF Transcript_18140/g.54210 Transcript_18140/m.54210 type:complete len:262 (-) Transcript_18140:27-812(-)
MQARGRLRERFLPRASGRLPASFAAASVVPGVRVCHVRRRHLVLHHRLVRSGCRRGVCRGGGRGWAAAGPLRVHRRRRRPAVQPRVQLGAAHAAEPRQRGPRVGGLPARVPPHLVPGAGERRRARRSRAPRVELPAPDVGGDSIGRRLRRLLPRARARLVRRGPRRRCGGRRSRGEGRRERVAWLCHACHRALRIPEVVRGGGRLPRRGHVPGHRRPGGAASCSALGGRRGCGARQRHLGTRGLPGLGAAAPVRVRARKTT